MGQNETKRCNSNEKSWPTLRYKLGQKWAKSGFTHSHNHTPHQKRWNCNEKWQFASFSSAVALVTMTLFEHVRAKFI
nr:MAG TPA: hypothetical protein [Caudoviricetes sp.]